MSTQNEPVRDVRIVPPRLSKKLLAPTPPVASLAPWQINALQKLTVNNPILVTDDDQVTRTFYRALLSQQFGLRMVDTYDAAEALKICQTQPVSLLISCLLKPPGMDGFELAEKLKANPVTCRIPLLFVSGSSHARDLALRAGADAFLDKPCHPYELLAEIWRLLRERAI